MGKIPNRIYLEKEIETGKIHHLWGDSPVLHSAYEHIEYIRKDELMDWLLKASNALKVVWLENPNNEAAYNKQIALASVIDKINSL